MNYDYIRAIYVIQFKYHCKLSAMIKSFGEHKHVDISAPILRTVQKYSGAPNQHYLHIFKATNEILNFLLDHKGD